MTRPTEPTPLDVPPPRLGLLAAHAVRSRRVALVSLRGPKLPTCHACAQHLATFAALRLAMERDDVDIMRDIIRGSVHLESGS